MSFFNLKCLAEKTKGKVLSTHQQEFKSVGTDTRENLTDKVFFALKGDQFDAHQFLENAVQSHAAILVVHEWRPEWEAFKEKVSIVLVQDTLKALQDFSSAYRDFLNPIVIGITGSNGKTTSKEFTAQVLSQFKKIHYSQGSFNNHWGVPLTLLSMPAGTEIAIVEMGMNHPGELTDLSHICKPNIVVCTSVGKAHIEHFGTIENIAKAKEEIYQASPQALAIFNTENEYTRRMYQHSNHKTKITFSSQDLKADVCFQLQKATAQSLRIKGQIKGVSGESEVFIFGVQNMVNLMVASACAAAVGIAPENIWKALSHCKTVWGRNQFVKLKNEAELIFDGYNANPDSFRALLENVTLLQVSGKKVGVFAEMREMGPQTHELHFELGKLVGEKDFDLVWFYGAPFEDFKRGLESSKFKKTYFVSGTYEVSLASKIHSMIHKGDVVLVKGSRGMRLEQFVLACDPLEFSKK